MTDIREYLLNLISETEYDYNEPLYRAVETIREARHLALWAMEQENIPDEKYMSANFIIRHTGTQ